ncbi:MAG: ribonuclease P protein component [Steroidobacteraceae bacterium]
MASRGAGLERLRFSPRRRLRRKSDFQAVYSRGRRLGDGLFAMVVRPSGSDAARLGLAVATKAAGNSVERNRIRRIIRETFRLRQRELPRMDVVVSARAAVRGARNDVLRTSLNTLWDRLIQQCASSPSS